MAIYFYNTYLVSPGNWRRLQWNTDTHTATESSLSSSSTISYPDNTIVDVYQKSATEVVMMTYSSLVNGLVTPYYSYPRLFLSETVLPGKNNTLIFKKCNTLVSPPTFEFGVYDNFAKVLNTYTYPLSLAPFCSPFEVSEDLVLSQVCVGTTLRRTYFDGDDDITVVDTPNSALCGYTPPVPDVVVTEVKRIKVDHTCYKNPVYLVWKNSLMGWDHWLFYNAQTENLATEDLGSFVQPIYDLETAEGTSNSLGKSASNVMILGANNLTTNQKDAIKDLFISPKIYQVYTDGSKRVVKIKPGSLVSETSSDRHSVEFEIELPETFTAKS